MKSTHFEKIMTLSPPITENLTHIDRSEYLDILDHKNTSSNAINYSAFSEKYF